MGSPGAKLVFVVALAVSGPALARSGCKITQLADIELAQGYSRSPTILAIAGDQEGAFIVDTGSPTSFITTELVDALELTRKSMPPGRLQTAQGEDVIEYTELPYFAIGNMSGRGMRFYIAPADWLQPGIAGLVGADIISNYAVEFDFGAKRFKLYLHERCNGEFPTWSDEPYVDLPIDLGDAQHIYFDLTLDGKRIEGLLDTGASTTVMSLRTARRTFGWDDNEPGLREVPRSRRRSDNSPSDPHAAGRGPPIYTYPFSTLSFEGVGVSNPDILLLTDLVRDRAEIMVGMNILEKLHLYIDYGEKVVHLTGEDAQ